MKTQVSLTKTLNKGFTLIELLIVIAILGVLAVVVLSALNPVELGPILRLLLGESVVVIKILLVLLRT